MRILSLLIFFAVLFSSNRLIDSPHGSEFKISCSTCHSSDSWKFNKEVYSFDHNTTKLPLVGQHKVVNCRQCHPTLVFKEAKSECNQCHKDVHQGTTGNDCSRCHTPASWLVKNINEIHQMSRFPLLGAHKTADCSLCHKSESTTRFDVPGIRCVDCHRANYMATTNPNHQEAGFSDDCASCHVINSSLWAGAGFDHSKFPLIQGHATPLCMDCHTNSRNFSGLSPECSTCHQKEYLATTNPNHVQTNFATTCKDCHTLNPGWRPTNFDHNIFPLKLGHATAKCLDCHIGGNFTSTPTDCYTCHQQDYLATKNPDHNTSGFSKTCQDCHTTNPGWRPTSFDHSRFPLTLGHSVPTCSDCHKGNYNSIPADCYTCHQQDFLNTTNPNHSAGGFSITCQDCHTTNPGWKPTNFNHSRFPLTLGHATPTCSDCHKGNYSTTSPDCFSCHQTDYNATVNPNHQSLGFSTTCTQCHNTNPGWKPASYTQHDSQSFPIYSGKHRGQWNACTDCHSNTSNYAIYTCINCHEHNKTDMDSKHRGQGGYSYTSAACFRCHPRGTSE